MSYSELETGYASFEKFMLERASRLGEDISHPVAKPVRFLLMEGSTEAERGIPPNVAVLAEAVRRAGYEIKVFSTNDYHQGDSTGDDTRVEFLQVPPVLKKDISDEMLYHIKDTPHEDFQELINEFKPHVVGLSSTEATYELARDIIGNVGVNRIDIFTIVGGAHPTLASNIVLDDEDIDAICRGEGEIGIVQLLDHIHEGRIILDGRDQDKEVLSSLVNFQVKRRHIGDVIIGPKQLMNVDDSPEQDWGPWEHRIPPRGTKFMRGRLHKTALVELSRGCPHKCTYCANVTFNVVFKAKTPEGKTKTFYRERSVSKFVEEVIRHRDIHGARYIYVGDETIFTTSKNRLREFIESYPLTGIPGETPEGQGLAFWCETRPEHLNYDLLKDFMDIGMQAVNIGVEAGDEDFRKNVLHRRISNKKMIQGMLDAVRAGAPIGANTIIGFPGETREMIMTTVELMRIVRKNAVKQFGIRRAWDSLSVMVHLFQPYQATPLRQTAIDMGIIKKDHICKDYRIDALGTGEGGLSAQEVKGLQRTFNLYVVSPKSEWGNIEIAEHDTPEGNEMFERLAYEYQMARWGVSNFDKPPKLIKVA